ncbi:MAG: hypothetical protein R6V02_08000 [Candidatus Aminicenantes bacterium]
MKTKIYILMVVILGLSSGLFNACTRSQIEEPSPLGPSTLAVLLDINSYPNVIFAGKSRQGVQITADLKKYDGVPISNQTVTFEIRDEFGSRLFTGFFEDNQSVVTKTTDGSGRATVTYYGPLAQEIFVANQGYTEDKQVYIYALVGWEGNEFIVDYTPVYIISDIVELTFDMQASPNVLWCSEENPYSEIRGIFQKADGAPIVGRKVFFKILKGKGEFEDGTTKTYVYTNEEGIAVIQYVGPTGEEMDLSEEMVTIQGQPETDWIHIDSPGYGDSSGDAFYLHKEMDIRLIKDTN